MAKPIASKGVKWIEQIPKHILEKLDQDNIDYSLKDVINICEEIIKLYDNGIETVSTWNGSPVPNLMMSTVTFRNKFKRYVEIDK
ncbi:hypothetical protein ACQKIC_01405 [Peribacillus sp. NPDC046944]|uniref:hypothetical protein n=1 Tax=unclassified Peribacillus TaxID=2675266 RepID=UPI003D01D759